MTVWLPALFKSTMSWDWSTVAGRGAWDAESWLRHLLPGPTGGPSCGAANMVRVGDAPLSHVQGYAADLSPPRAPGRLVGGIIHFVAALGGQILRVSAYFEHSALLFSESNAPLIESISQVVRAWGSLFVIEADWNRAPQAVIDSGVHETIGVPLWPLRCTPTAPGRCMTCPSSQGASWKTLSIAGRWRTGTVHSTARSACV